MVELADALTVLGGAFQDVWFKMRYMTELEKVFGQRVMGDRWVDRHEIVKESTREQMWKDVWKVPVYHKKRPGDLEIFSTPREFSVD